MTLFARTTQRHPEGVVSVETHVLPCGLDRRREHRVLVNGSCVGLVGSVVAGLRLGKTILEIESRAPTLEAPL